MTVPHRDLDVRPILRDGGEPFSAIMEAVAELAPGQSLRLLASFKPIPLFQVLGARGFEPVSREIGGGDWEVVFTPAAATAPVVDTGSSIEPSAGDDWQVSAREIDCRDLDPPEPMVKTLEGVEALAAGEMLAALLPREPLFLFKELAARGYQWRGGFEPEGHYRIVIRAGSPVGTQS